MRPRPTPDLSDLRLGVPAALVALTLLLAVVWANLRLPLVEHYERRLARHASFNYTPAMLVCQKRLLSLEPDRPELRFALAKSHERLGDISRAEALLRSLAPTDRPGYLPAHEWLARRAYSQRFQPGRAKEAEQHCLMILKALPNASQTQALLGLLYLELGRHQEARRMLSTVAKENPLLLLALANSCAALGDHAAARQHTEAAHRAAKENGEAHPDDPTAQLLWSKSYLAQGNFQAAIDVLSKADPDKTPGFRSEIASVYAAWATAILRSGRPQSAVLLSVFERGLTLEPKHEPLLNTLVLSLISGGPLASTVRTRLESKLGGGPLAAPFHFALGNEAWADGRQVEARDHWEAAYKLNPNIPMLSNNLAYSLAYTPPADPARALALADLVLSQSQGDPRMRLTRGQILSRLGRWTEAVTELEHALSEGETSDDTHNALAEAYEAVGQKGKAAEHRRGL